MAGGQVGGSPAFVFDVQAGEGRGQGPAPWGRTIIIPTSQMGTQPSRGDIFLSKVTHLVDGAVRI